MLGAEAEASALDAYYAARSDAKELVGLNLWDEGMEKWSCALGDVAPYISSERLDALKREFDYTQSRRNEKAFADDADSDSSDKADGIEDSGYGGGNDSPDMGLRRNIRRGVPIPRSSYTLRTAKTLPPRLKEDEKCISRLPTTSILELRESPQLPPTIFRDDDDRSPTPHGDTEPVMSSEPTTVPEPTASPAVDESGPSGLPKGEGQVAGSSAQPRPSAAPDCLMSKENGDQPVKVAILDSGFALTGEVRKAMKPYLSRIQGTKTFTHEFPDPKTPQEKQQALDDLVGHGTTVAYQLMKTCPSAHVYIAKVTIAESAHEKAVPDKGAVTRAIRHAVTPVAEGGWGVDIINMSFGWGESEIPGTVEAADGVSGAIEFANRQGVLFFAAASNHGLTHLNDILYPARDPRVISVDAEDGIGNPAPFALRSLHGGGGVGVRYCAPGLSVNSPVSAEPICGSSFACPVAAGVAALVLEFARRGDVSLSESKSVQRALSSAQGMSTVFGRMSQQAANHLGFKMLYPWHFLNHGQREKVALDIVGQLETEFGRGKVGSEVAWGITWHRLSDSN